MADNARFHNKLHRRNHHSIPTAGYPDSGTDPIASSAEPFQGNMVVNATVSAQDLHINKNAFVGGNQTILGNLSVYGDYSYFETYVTATSSLSVINHGTGPALTVAQKGFEPVARFLDRDGGGELGLNALLIADTGQIVINDVAPKLDRKVTISGSMTASGNTEFQAGSAASSRTLAANAGRAFGFDSAAFNTGIATGTRAFAMNTNTVAAGSGSFSHGINTNAFGDSSHAEGDQTLAQAYGSHAEGELTSAEGDYSHTEGIATRTIGFYAHAEGDSTQAYGTATHAEGVSTHAHGEHSHAEGFSSSSLGDGSHTEGYRTSASGDYSHAEGWDTIAINNGSHAEGLLTKAAGNFSHTEGYDTKTEGLGSHAEGLSSRAVGNYSHAEGLTTVAYGSGALAAGQNNLAFGLASFATGIGNTVSGIASFATGRSNRIAADYGFVIGDTNVIQPSGYYTNPNTDTYLSPGTASFAGGSNSIVRGTETFAFGRGLSAFENIVVAFGDSNLATGSGTFVHGVSVRADGIYSHAEGRGTYAFGDYSHAEGEYSYAGGCGAHAQGRETVAMGDGSVTYGYQTSSVGKYAIAGGALSRANAIASTAIGYGAVTSPNASASIVVGFSAYADGPAAMALGYATSAMGNYTFAQGISTVAQNEGSYALGTNSRAIHDNSYVFCSDRTTPRFIDTTQTGQYMISATGGVYIPGYVGLGIDAPISDEKLTVRGNVLVTGNLSAYGEMTYLDTIVSVTSALSVVNVGTGPAVTVVQRGAQPIARFIDGDAIAPEDQYALFIENNGNIGVGTQFVPDKMNIRGNTNMYRLTAASLNFYTLSSRGLSALAADPDFHLFRGRIGINTGTPVHPGATNSVTMPVTSYALHIRGGNIRVDGVDYSDSPGFDGSLYDSDGQSLFDLRSARVDADYSLSISQSGLGHFMKFFGGRDGDTQTFINVKEGDAFRIGAFRTWYGTIFQEHLRVDGTGNLVLGYNYPHTFGLFTENGTEKLSVSGNTLINGSISALNNATYYWVPAVRVTNVTGNVINVALSGHPFVNGESVTFSLKNTAPGSDPKYTTALDGTYTITVFDANNIRYTVAALPTPGILPFTTSNMQMRVSRAIGGYGNVLGQTTITTNLSVNGSTKLGDASTDINTIRGIVRIADSSASNGILLGTSDGLYDTNIYRESANVLKTDDSYIVTGFMNVSGNTTLGDAGTDTLRFNASAVEIPNSLNIDSNTFFIDSTNDRVGVGTSTPAVRLAVNGGIDTTSNLTVSGNTTLGDANTDVLIINGTTITTPNNLNIDSNLLFIDAVTNRIGVGTNAPNEVLTVFGTISAGNGNIITTGSLAVSGNVTLGDASGDTLRINASTLTIPNNLNIDSNTLFIDAANNRIGVGTASPSVALNVAGAVDLTNNLTVSGNTVLGDTSTDTVRINGTTQAYGPFGTAFPTTVLATAFTVTDAHTTLIVDVAAGTCTLTLPTASNYTGRWLYLKTIQNQLVISNASNVVPLASNVAGTAILSNVAGRWAWLQSDGTNWVIMAAN